MTDPHPWYAGGCDALGPDGTCAECAKISDQSPTTKSVPFEPTEAMLIAAREWSRKKYGKPIGNDAARGCWQAMMEAADAE